MPVCNDEVFPTIAVEVEECGSPSDKFLSDGRDTRCGSKESEEWLAGLAEIAVQGMQFIFVVGHPYIGLTSAHRVGNVEPHAAVGSAVAVACRTGNDAHFFNLDGAFY